MAYAPSGTNCLLESGVVGGVLALRERKLLLVLLRLLLGRQLGFQLLEARLSFREEPGGGEDGWMTPRVAAPKVSGHLALGVGSQAAVA